MASPVRDWFGGGWAEKSDADARMVFPEVTEREESLRQIRDVLDSSRLTEKSKQRRARSEFQHVAVDADYELMVPEYVEFGSLDGLPEFHPGFGAVYHRIAPRHIVS